MTFVRELGVKVPACTKARCWPKARIDHVSANERVIEVYLGR